MKADTLTKVLNVFDPREPLSGSKLKMYYVERAGTPLHEMDIYLREIKKPVKLLFTGHRGSGKSTELFRLISLLEDKFFVVRFSVLEAVNPFDVTYVDLLLALATRLFAQATDAKVIKKRGLALLKEELLDDIYRWFTREVLGEIPFVAPKPDAELSIKVNFLALQLESKVSTEAASRKQIRERLELRLSELLERMNYAIDQVARATKRRVLLIVEDIDKLDLARARDFFLEHATSLTTPKAYIVYTFPVSLRYSNDFVQIIRNFNEAFVLPNIKVFDRDGTPYEPGRQRLREVLTKRMNEDLIEEEALEKLIESSGGLMVTLIELVQRATVNAITGRKERIDIESANKAIAKERADYQALLEREHYEALRQRHADKTLVNEEIVRALLHNLSLLEYTNDEVWCDVHPIVLSLIEK